LGACFFDQLVAPIDQLFLLCEFHGYCLELLADLVDIGVGHRNEVTEPSSRSEQDRGVSARSVTLLLVLSDVIFVNMSDQELLDSAQVAARLSVTVGTVYKLR